MNQLLKEFKKTIRLSFPPDISGRPVVCNLTRLYDLTFNILQAKISPRQEGRMTIEIAGREDDYQKGLSYLKERGIRISSVEQTIFRNDETCMHCGLCTTLCPTKALDVDPESRLVLYDINKCTACGICASVCPVKSMSIEIENGY